MENVYGAVPPVTVTGPLLNGTPTSPEFVAEQVTCGIPTIVIEHVPLPTTPLASVTWIVNVPDAVGVPVTAPVEVFRVKPAGNVPLPIENVYGAVPPVTVIGPLLNGTPTSPEFVAEHVTCGIPTIVIEQVPLPTTPLASVTLIVNVPDAVGVPVTAPVEVFRVKPA